MNRIAEQFEGVLALYVGDAVAWTVLRGIAGDMDKEVEDLEREDIPPLKSGLRLLLEPVMAGGAVSEALDEAERRAIL